jgi:hypothetical protein
MAFAVRFMGMQAISAGPGTIAAATAETLLARLPASVQKEIRWSQPAVIAALRPLHTETLSRDLLDAVAERLRRPFETVLRALLPVFMSDRPAWIAAVRAENERESALLRQVTNDADTTDTIDWIYGHLGLLLDLWASVPPAANVDEMLTGAREAPSLALLAGLGALAVAIDLAGQDEPDPERIRDLLAVALLMLSQVERVMHATTGLSLDPFKVQTPAERGAKALRALEGLREGFTREEYEAFCEACRRSEQGAS